MKVRLVYETEIPESGVSEEYDVLISAVCNLKQDMRMANSVDDLSDVFVHWYGLDNKKNERAENNSQSTGSGELGKG